MTILRNDFHKTTVKIKASEGETVSPSTIRRMRRALCGMPECRCSDATGVRGGVFSVARIGGGDEYQVVSR